MPKISNRGIQIPESPIRKLVPFAEAAKEKGRKVFHLNIGQPDIKTPENALHAVRNLKEDVIRYSHSAGNISYRKKLAAFYTKLGITVDHTQLMITTGGSEAISFAMLSCLNPGDGVIIPEPFYANYNGFGIATGIQLSPVTSYIEDDFSLPPIEALESLVTANTRGIMICNPNNPTGYLYSKEEMLALRELILKHDLYLFCDEVYREFCYDGAEHFSCLQLEGVEEHVVMVDSVSKRYSACGARIGALVTRNNKIIQTALKFAQARLSPPSLGQILGEAALDSPDSYFKQVYDEYVERRNYMVAALNKMEGVLCPVPKGAFYTVAQLPVDDADKFAQWLLSDFEHENQTVMLAPASGFYANRDHGRKQVRIAYVLNLEELKKAMECLDRALKEYPGREVP